MRTYNYLVTDPYSRTALGDEAERSYYPYEPEIVTGCMRCGDTYDHLYNGYCIHCLGEIYDEHLDEMLPFFEKYDPYEWTGDCPMLDEMWGKAEYAEFLKDYALDDAWCIADYFKDRGWI